MKRRQAIKLSAGTIGWCVSGASLTAMISSCNSEKKDSWKAESLTESQMNLVKTLCDLIIPRTNTPGAVDALVHRYFDEAISHYIEEKDKMIFLSGFERMDAIAIEKGEHFAKSPFEVQNEIMNSLLLDAEDQRAQGNYDRHFIDAMIDFVKHAFFTSEVGATQVLNYKPIPGRYDGCISLEEGDVNWWYK